MPAALALDVNEDRQQQKQTGELAVTPKNIIMSQLQDTCPTALFSASLFLLFFALLMFCVCRDSWEVLKPPLGFDNLRTQPQSSYFQEKKTHSPDGLSTVLKTEAASPHTRTDIVIQTWLSVRNSISEKFLPYSLFKQDMECKTSFSLSSKLHQLTSRQLRDHITETDSKLLGTKIVGSNLLRGPREILLGQAKNRHQVSNVLLLLRIGRRRRFLRTCNRSRDSSS